MVDTSCCSGRKRSRVNAAGAERRLQAELILVKSLSKQNLNRIIILKEKSRLGMSGRQKWKLDDLGIRTKLFAPQQNRRWEAQFKRLPENRQLLRVTGFDT
ncbi:unnamed protein product [Caretta caretta]